jgi:hypothetical protein
MIRSTQRILTIGKIRRGGLLFLALSLALLSGCGGGGGEYYRNPNMDFGSLQTVAVMPLMNLSKEQAAGDRVRDVFINSLLTTGAMYVIPPGELGRALIGAGVGNAAAPSPEEVIKLCKQLKIDGVITGTIREYGEVRSGTAVANVISMSMQMFEGQTGKVVWTASTTRGGVGITERLFGGGGESMNVVTEKAVNELISKLFK